MNQFIVKVPGGEYELDKVLEILLEKECEIASISIAGGGFMGGSVITYIVVNGEDPGINLACYDYIPSYQKKYEMPIIDSLLAKGDIDKKEYEKRISKLKNPINGVEIIKTNK